MRIGSELGLRVQQWRMDIIGNNLANVNTPGFKAGLVNFAEALNAQAQAAYQVSYGSIPLGIPPEIKAENPYYGQRLQLEQGALVDTGNEWNVAIQGEGFFQMVMNDGRKAYTRAGIFQPDQEGNLVNPKGDYVFPQVEVPEGVKSVQVKPNGSIVGTFEEGERVIGELQLARFANPDGLQQIGDNLFLATESSGTPEVGRPGTGKLGTLRGGSLESSNVDLVSEMTNLVQAQRAYQMDARLIKQGDEMWQQANNLRR